MVLGRKSVNLFHCPAAGLLVFFRPLTDRLQCGFQVEEMGNPVQSGGTALLKIRQDMPAALNNLSL